MKRKVEENEKRSEAENTNEAQPLGKKLSDLIKHKKKFSSKKAKVIFTLEELKTFEKKVDDSEKREWRLPQFFVQDLQRVLLYSLIGTKYRFYPRWCKILRQNQIKSVNLITVNNFSELDYNLHKSKFKKFEQIFGDLNGAMSTIEFVSPTANGSTFIDEFISVPITRTQWLSIRDGEEYKEKQRQVVEKYKSLYEKIKATPEKERVLKASTSALDKIPRTCLLMSAAQMIREDYPMPFDESGAHNYAEYVYTSDEYAPVHDHSPLFSIDCEMCYNEDGDMEPVWLAMVNENLDCVYETFIKPKKEFTTI